MMTTHDQRQWARWFLVLAPLLLMLSIGGCKPTSKPIITRMRVTPECGVAPVSIECFAAVSGGNETGSPLGGTNTLDVLWDFGDGASSTTSRAFHTYAVAGDYTVTVSTSDPDGNTAARSMPVSVRADSLTISAATNFPDGQATTADPIQFTMTARSCDINFPAQPDNEAKMEYLWQMGDATSPGSPETTFYGPSPVFRYNAPGTYHINLTVTYPQLAITRQTALQLVITP